MISNYLFVNFYMHSQMNPILKSNTFVNILASIIVLRETVWGEMLGLTVGSFHVFTEIECTHNLPQCHHAPLLTGITSWQIAGYTVGGDYGARHHHNIHITITN